MSACWGFDLDMSAVRLMRRDGNHWQEVARENIDGPDIEDRLMAMVDQVGTGEAVALFLPRDQILYTDVKVTSDAAAREEIEAAMEGRTPYTLDELEIDWLFTGPDTARVAAIAKETLDEAANFAEVRGLTVSGYGSLADSADFPRNPSFGAEIGPTLTARAEPEVTFTSARTASRPPLSEDTEPVVRVEDSRPVMEVVSRPLPPLDPGKPLEQVQQPPRVRTDIAAGTLSGAAASLTPPKPALQVRTPTFRPRQTLIAFAVAAVLTVGIAAIVWSILPLAPGTEAPSPPESSETGSVAPENAPDVATAALPDLPRPDAPAQTAGLAAPPEIGAPPAIPGVETGARAPLPSAPLPAVAPDRDPVALAATPLARSPETFAAILTEDPSQGLDGAEDSSETTLDIYLASIERRDLAFDAIALPPASALQPSALPLVLAPPQLNPAPPGPKFVAVAPVIPPEAVDPPPTAPETAAASADAQAGAALRPTALAAALPARAPRPRPTKFVETIERDRFGGRTRSELANISPPPRPASAQAVALAGQTVAAPSELAVASSLVPRLRPADFDAIVANAILQARAATVTASLDFQTPDTTAAIEAALADELEEEPGTRPQDSPRLAIPSNASVSRQATIEDAIRLNRINLVGVYGLPSDRRALIRLPSGRYVKVKVGDRIDGGTVAQIRDSELIYRKGGRTLSLAMPKG